MEEVLKAVLKDIRVGVEDKKFIKHLSEKVIDSIEQRIKKKGIKAEAFIGGSLAKDTLVKNKIFDVDIFLRFNPKYSEEEIKKLFRKIFFLFKIKGERIKLKKLHGSRDYNRIVFKNHPSVEIEIIPVLAVKKPEEARNVTDLSYFHVNYIKSKLSRHKKLADDIVLAKAFCHANKCYGAESYIKGFSGYALELLVIHYKGFKNFLAELSKENNSEKIIIDLDKKYKDHSDILAKMNKSRLESPVILIDPTYRERNAVSALSHETFEQFKRSAHRFLEKPSSEFFIEKKMDITSLRKRAHENDGIFLKLELTTNKQAGDIAGTKLLKVYNLVNRNIVHYFDFIGRGFEYHESINKAYIYYALKRKKERIVRGPSLEFKQAVENFKKVHPVWYIRENKIYSSKPTDINEKHFLDDFKRIHGKALREMGVTGVRIVGD